MQPVEPEITKRARPETTYAPIEDRTLYDPAFHQAEPYDDAFVEALAKRVVHELSTEITTKMTAKNTMASSNQRLVLAIISLVALLGTVAIAISVSAATHVIWAGLLAIFIVCMALCIINIVYNVGSR